MSDAKVKEHTGCDWEKWVYALDRKKAYELTHTELAKLIKDKYKTPAGAFPNASRISDQSISFTVGPHVDEEDMRYTADVLKEAIMRNSA